MTDDHSISVHSKIPTEIFWINNFFLKEKKNKFVFICLKVGTLTNCRDGSVLVTVAGDKYSAVR